MDRLSSWLYPPYARCYGCGHPRLDDQGDHLCADCRAKLHSLRRTGAPFQVEGIEKIYAPYSYEGVTEALVHRLKYDCVRDVAVWLGRDMAGSLDGAGFDAIIPVPLHKERLLERGFNQALLLGQEITRHRGIPVLEALRRTRNTGQQAKLNKVRRMENMLEAFEACQKIEGMRVLLVDDVCTTGATAHACAQALFRAGVGSVRLCVAAVTEAGHKG